MRRLTLIAGPLVVLVALASPALAVPEVCGDGIDNDSDGMTDDGCWPQKVTGLCTSPLSCERTGYVAPVTGQLIYPDDSLFNVTVPYGPSLSLGLTYFSQYDPGYNDPSATDYKAPLGFGWQYKFMSWVSLDTTPDPDEAVVHTVDGLDVLFERNGTSAGWEVYTLKNPGYQPTYKRLLRDPNSPHRWILETQTGLSYRYWGTGDASYRQNKLRYVMDGFGENLYVDYSTTGQTVTDAIRNRRFRFTYDGTTNLIDQVRYEVKDSGGSWATEAELEIQYSGYKLTKIKFLAGDTLRDYTYDTNGKLTQVKDGDAVVVADFYYLTASGEPDGKVARIDTGVGTLGYDYAVDCDSDQSDELAVFFHHDKSGTACDADGDCGTGYYCGGETDEAGTNTGICFRAQRCVDVSSSTGEDLPTTVTASCSTCATDAEYAWDSDAFLTARKNPRAVGGSALWTTYEYNSDGLVIKRVEGDDNNSASSVPAGARVTYFKYGETNFPGLLTEMRVLSNLKAGGTCTATTVTDCKRTIYAYDDTTGELDSAQQVLFTYDISGTSATLASSTETTAYTYDAQGRLTEIDGPNDPLLDEPLDTVRFTYWTASSTWNDGYVKDIHRDLHDTGALTTTVDDYDIWGNSESSESSDGTYTCFDFDDDYNVLIESREAMNGQTSCATTHASDLVSSYTYDKGRRLVKRERPLGDCTHYAYDTSGRMTSRKDRDDCVSTSSGDTIEYTYSDDGQRLKVEFKNSSGTVTKRQELVYAADRRVSERSNPVTSGAKRTFSYTDDGLLAHWLDEDSSSTQMAKTSTTYDALSHVTAKNRYKTASTYDAWTFTAGVQLNLPTKVEDDDSKAIDWLWDDLGRKAKQVTPDHGTIWYDYDVSGNLTTILESGGAKHVFVYDSLGRLLTEDWDDSCSSTAPEISYAYDDDCGDVSFNCDNQSGRLATVKTRMFCDVSLGDDSFDQTVSYGYDDAGRLVKESHEDDGSRLVYLGYSYDENGNVTKIEPPWGGTTYFTEYTYGSAGNNSDANKVTQIKRGTATVVSGVEWSPFGPLAEYLQENTKNSNKIKATFSHNLAYRPTELKWAEDGGSGSIFEIDYTEDHKGRITLRDYTNGHSSLKDSHFTYDQLDRVECESAATGSCPTSGSNLQTTFVSFSASNDRGDMHHQCSDYENGELKWVPTLSSGSDKLSSIKEDGWGGSRKVDYQWDARGRREYDRDSGKNFDDRDYTYGSRNRLKTVSGIFPCYSTGGGSGCDSGGNADWHDYILTNAHDHKNRRVFKSFFDDHSNDEGQWFFYYDHLDRLIEAKHTPDISASSTYTIYQFIWLGERPVAYYQVDGGATTKRYYHADELGRPVEVWDWPASGDTSRVWASNADLYAWDDILVGRSVYQPLSFPGQYVDWETTSVTKCGKSETCTLANVLYMRPPLSDNRARTYDPFTGGYLQVDPLVAQTWEAYSYAGHNPVARIDPSGTSWIGDFIDDHVCELRMLKLIALIAVLNATCDTGSPACTIAISIFFAEMQAFSNDCIAGGGHYPCHWLFGDDLRCAESNLTVLPAIDGGDEPTPDEEPLPDVGDGDKGDCLSNPFLGCPDSPETRPVFPSSRELQDGELSIGPSSPAHPTELRFVR